MTNIVFFVTAGLVNIVCDHRFAQNTDNIQVLGYSWQDTHNPGPASPGWGIELAYVGGSRFVRLQFVHSFVFFFRNDSYWSRPESSQLCKLRRLPEPTQHADVYLLTACSPSSHPPQLCGHTNASLLPRPVPSWECCTLRLSLLHPGLRTVYMRRTDRELSKGTPPFVSRRHEIRKPSRLCEH
jgi:hypothetical protein